MNRAVWFILCMVVGLELIAWGLLVPAHIRAVDAEVLELTAGRRRDLFTEGAALVNLEKTGAARMLLQVANLTGAPGREKLAAAIAELEGAKPKLKILGAPAVYLERVLERAGASADPRHQAFIDLLLNREVREAVTETLQHSRNPAVLEILKTRELTNTVVFPPALSGSGQPLDATIVLAALLAQQDQFASRLRNGLQTLVATANRGGEVEPLEALYLDLLALGKRLDWGQLVNLVQRIQDAPSLHQAAVLLREKEAFLPTVYAAIHFAESPQPVAKYLGIFVETGIKDLTYALGAGGAAVRELLTKQQPIHYPTWRQHVTQFQWGHWAFEPMARLVADQPWFGFGVKYALCLLGALLVARAMTYLSAGLADEIVEQRPLLTGPQMVIALCLLFTVLFFTESTVKRAAPVPQTTIRVKIPMARAAPGATIPQKTRAMIDKISLMSLLIFFVMQAVIYVICRMKLAEIRRQSLPSKLKLRLLENEEQLFDAGLYFGFVGTVASLILVSIGIIKPSLMAAYSSTSFGIVFVSILKIVHVRPYKRRLILDAEITEREAQPA